MRINTNMSAMNTYSRLTNANTAKSNSLAKLSSGLRINKAGDDAAGLAISEKMKNQVSGLKQATRNAQDGISLIQTAEGALSETHSILNRMRDLAVQASNDTNTTEDRLEIQKEINSLLEEVDRIADDTQFNTMELLTGKFDGGEGKDGTSLRFHIGANNDQNMDVNIANMDTVGLALTKGNDREGGLQVDMSELELGEDEKIDEKIAELEDKGVLTQESADAAIATLDEAIKTVTNTRSDLGSVQNRLEHTIANLTATMENLAEANSRIMDVDMAEEMMEFSKNNILSQASTAMLAQANQMPQGVLQLLQ